MDRDEQARRQSVASPPKAEPPAFGKWLQRGLAQQYAETLREPLPDTWLTLLETLPKT
jgi:hypothetical protein